MAMVELGSTPSGENSRSLTRIAERQHISVAYLEQLFLKLRRAGLVESIRGRTGGYRLARPADEITIFEVMAAVAEGTDMTRCSSGLGTPCMAGRRCRAHDLWCALGRHIERFLRSVSLQDVISGSVRADMMGMMPVVDPLVVIQSGSGN